jgi:UDP-N-acetylglucosamine--N-acetylmuramyl-(pentapeptide) pyrophosphoryl-undecaprenol N-acetylglucosamine transferase
MRTPRMIIAGGGTGGHVAPALALAEDWSERYGKDSVLFLCGDTQLERGMIQHAGFRLTPLHVQRPTGGIRGKATTIFSAARSVPAARRVIRESSADVVVCVGGYAALPGAMAAGLLRVPVCMLEANAVPGRVTRTIGRFARVCYAHMPLSRDLECRVEVTGNPVRAAFQSPVRKAEARRALGLVPDLPTLLVMGGSQGASGINEALLGALPMLESVKGRMQVLHLTGRNDVLTAETAWRGAGLRHHVKAFTHNTSTWMAAADIALTRAGAGTISELLALGVPMILSPYPHAADDHQRANALWVAGAQAGVLVPQTALTPARVQELMESLLLNTQARERAAAAARALSRPDAATRINDRILVEIGLRTELETADETGRVAA